MKGVLLPSHKTFNITGRLKKQLLYCGIFSMIWYIAVNIIATLFYPGYNSVTQVVSELSAIDAPTRSMWIILCILYTLLLMAFGWGVWLSAGDSKKLHFVAVVIILDALIGLYWPPMHQREVIAAGGGTISDTLHIVWAYIHLTLMLLMIGFGAAALGRGFRIYSVVTVLIFLVFGLLTAQGSSGIKSGEPTPYVGVWERINMAAYMLWIILFAFALLKKGSNRL